MPLATIVMGLAQFAPSLFRFFGAGETSTAVADQVANLARTVTGAQSPEEALTAIRASAELQAKFQERALDLDATLEQAYLADRQNARSRDVEFIKAGKHNTRADVMVGGAVVGLLACLFVLVFFQNRVPGEVVGIVSTVAGLFGACLRDAFQFEFGSSRSSRNKDDVIARAASR